MELEFKKELRNEIMHLRSHTKKELKQIILLEKRNKIIDEEDQQEFDAILMKKQEYEQIPEDKIEEYINQAYIIYDNQQKILKKIEEYNFSTEQLDNETIEEVIISVQEMNDLDYAKAKKHKKVLEEFSNLFSSLFNPISIDKNTGEIPLSPILLMFGSIGVAFSYLFTMLLSIISGQPYPLENYEVLQKMTLIFGGLYATSSLPNIIIAFQNVFNYLNNYKSQIKKYPESMKIINKLGISDFVENQAEATKKIEEIMNKGLVK